MDCTPAHAIVIEIQNVHRSTRLKDPRKGRRVKAPFRRNARQQLHVISSCSRAVLENLGQRRRDAEMLPIITVVDDRLGK